MQKKKFSKKLVLNKTTVASLNAGEQENVLAGIFPFPRPISEGCVYTVTCLCTSPGCNDSRYGNNGCMYTNYGDMAGCPATMTVCGELYCP
ncbi:MAG: hypothetical protein GY940_11100 [bacterium]|nr:hypothetical protein [bacterium]